MSILCAGLAVCDLLLKPVDATVLTQDTSTAENIRLAVGGDALNVALGIAGLGGRSGLITKVGTDDLGSYLINRVRDTGVDIRWIKRVDTPTSASGVLIRSDGERSFLSYKGACHTLGTEDFSSECFAGADILYIGSAFDLPKLDGDGMIYVMELAQRCGLKTVLDVTGEPTQEDMKWFSSVLKHTDYFLPSLREVCRLTGCDNAIDAAQEFAGIGAGCVAVKLGEHGSLLLDHDEVYRIPAYPAKVVDTTGAGDSFVAGFLYGLEQGYPVTECAILGNVCGSVAVEHLGASGHYVSTEEITMRMQWIKNKYNNI